MESWYKSQSFYTYNFHQNKTVIVPWRSLFRYSLLQGDHLLTAFLHCQPITLAIASMEASTNWTVTDHHCHGTRSLSWALMCYQYRSAHRQMWWKGWRCWAAQRCNKNWKQKTKEESVCQVIVWYMVLLQTSVKYTSECVWWCLFTGKHGALSNNCSNALFQDSTFQRSLRPSCPE